MLMPPSPTVICFLGSHESYVRNVLAPACTPVKEGGLGYRGVVVNFRGCAAFASSSGHISSLDRHRCGHSHH
jgi:predicted alpha/beta-fold hydrolase